MSKKKGRKISNQAEVDWAKRKLKFSFEHYDAGNKKHCISYWTNSQTLIALERLKEVNANNYYELVQKQTVYHFHQVDWSQTIYKKGFPNPKLKGLPNFQFALLSVNEQKTRVYGAFYQDTFFIVWFDFDHLIRPTRI